MLGIALSLASAPAQAQTAAVTCSSLQTQNPVFLLLGATQEPLIKTLGKRIREGTTPTTIIYRTAGSCTNVAEIVKAAPKITQNASYIPSVAQDPTWDPSKPAPQCTMDIAGGADLDVANSNVFLDACTTAPLPAGLAAFNGPIQAYTFVAPKGSSQTAITAAEGYFTFGFNGNGQSQPWTDKNFIFILPTTRSTMLSLMLAVGINPATKGKGTLLQDPNEVLNAVAQSATPEKTIGIVGAELYDVQRDKLKALAFKAYKQRYAYYADSTSTSFDKFNLRNGLYFPWSPTVYVTKVDAQGVPVNPRVKYLLDLLMGNDVTPAAGFDPQEDVIKAGVVPICAMKVTRSVEAGNLSLYDAPEPCHCYYETKVGAASAAACTACTNDSTCGAGKCRHGFCEAR